MTSKRRCCCCNETCPPGAYCTTCGQTDDEAASWEVVIAGLSSSATCGEPTDPCDISVVNGTYALTFDSAVDNSDLGIISHTCIYTGSAYIGEIPPACYLSATYGMTLYLELHITYDHTPALCECSQSFQLYIRLGSDLYNPPFDVDSPSLLYDPPLACDEMTGLVLPFAMCSDSGTATISKL